VAPSQTKESQIYQQLEEAWRSLPWALTGQDFGLLTNKIVERIKSRWVFLNPKFWVVCYRVQGNLIQHLRIIRIYLFLCDFLLKRNFLVKLYLKWCTVILKEVMDCHQTNKCHDCHSPVQSHLHQEAGAWRLTHTSPGMRLRIFAQSKGQLTEWINYTCHLCRT
jgi:hypothetical protein